MTPLVLILVLVLRNFEGLPVLCAEDMYVVHLSERQDGKLDALTDCGRYTRDRIRLERPVLAEWRRTRRAALEDIPVLEAALASGTSRLW
jgi:hypothetical protein